MDPPFSAAPPLARSKLFGKGQQVRRLGIHYISLFKAIVGLFGTRRELLVAETSDDTHMII